jgi:hypothetical protein
MVGHIAAALAAANYRTQGGQSARHFAKIRGFDGVFFGLFRYSRRALW